MIIDALLAAAARGGSDGALGAAVDALDGWVLRAADRAPTLDPQLGYWFVQAVVGRGAARTESRASLETLGRAFGGDLIAAAEGLATAATYERLVPSPNPHDAINQGAQSCAAMLASLGQNPDPPASAYAAYADGFAFDQGFFYYSMPVRAAMLRAGLRVDDPSRGAFARIRALASSVQSQLPFDLDPQPRGNEVLGFVLTEALSDALYAERVVDAGGGLRLPFGQELLAAIEDSIAPRDDNDPAALAALDAFSRDRANHTYGYRIEGNRLVITNTAPAFRDYPFAAIIVPSYSPLGARTPLRVLDPVCADRVRRARADFDAGLAPFVLVSGGSIYPMGTPSNDARMMRDALLAMGLPRERILLDARARHSTTNLRNAGRLLRAHGLAGPALITTIGPFLVPILSCIPCLREMTDQDFYFSYPEISQFDARCQRELGYRVGEYQGGLRRFLCAQRDAARAVVQGKGPFTQDLARAVLFDDRLAHTSVDTHSVIVPSATVSERYSLRDPLDP